MNANLLMLSGDRDVAAGRRGPFNYTLGGLAEQFARVDVLTPRAAGGAPRQIHQTVHVQPSPSPRLLQAVWLIRRGLALAKQRRYHLIVSHDYGIFANGLAAAVLSARLGVPHVSEIHHIPAHPKRAQWWEPLAKLSYRLYLAVMAPRVRAIRVVNTREVPDLMRRWGVPTDKIVTLPSAHVDRATFADCSDRQVEYELGFVGRLVANKGLPYLAAVFAAVAADRPDANFVVIGQGPELDALRASLRARGILERVHFIDWLDDPAELAQVYRRMRALVCCSRSEGGPRVCLEAMACGTPVFATPVGLMPELIEDGTNGWMLPWSRVHGASVVVRALRDRAALQAAGRRARAATEPYARDQVLGAYASAYRSFADAARA